LLYFSETRQIDVSNIKIYWLQLGNKGKLKRIGQAICEELYVANTNLSAYELTPRRSIWLSCACLITEHKISTFQNMESSGGFNNMQAYKQEFIELRLGAF